MDLPETLSLPLPDEGRKLDEEIRLFQTTTLPLIMAAYATLVVALKTRAAADHGHNIGDVEGLAAMLDKFMPADAEFRFAGLADVVGFSAAPDGYVPVKTGNALVLQSLASALGHIEVSIGQVKNLSDALSKKLDADRIWTGSQAQYDALPSKSATTYYFII